MKLKFFYDNVNYRLRNVKGIKELIVKVIRDENKVPDDLNFIFTDDRQIKKINREFLKRNTFTDVIAFDYGDKKRVVGEIYISLDTVRKNARNYNVSLRKEIIRVIVHGTLHLCGYNDKSTEDSRIMKLMEEKWIKEYDIR